MSITIQCYTVVIRIDAIKKKYLGGIEAFEKENRSWMDEDLAGVAFMSISDAEEFIDTLVSKGFEYIVNGTCADITIVDMFRGRLLRCEWIETSVENPPDKATVKPTCWLKKPSAVFIRRAPGMSFEEFKKVCIERFEKAGLLKPRTSTSEPQLPDEGQIHLHNIMEKALQEKIKEANTRSLQPGYTTALSKNDPGK